MLNQQQKDLVFGSLLGDGNLQTETAGRTWRYRAGQKEYHHPYLDQKYNILANLCGSPPAMGSYYDPRTEKTYYRRCFNTLQSPDFCYHGRLFYRFDPVAQKFVKQVPSEQVLLSDLTPQAVAYWYMDDGSIKLVGHSNAMRICTESFTKDEVKRLRKVLLKKYNIVTTQFKKTGKKGYIGDRIAIPEQSSTAFRDLIKPYLVKCMAYKVSDGNRGSLIL